MAPSSVTVMTARRLLPGPPIDADAPVVAPLAQSFASLATLVGGLLALLIAGAAFLIGPGAFLLLVAVAGAAAWDGARRAQKQNREHDVVELPEHARVLRPVAAVRPQATGFILGFLAYAWTPFVLHGPSQLLALGFGAYVLGRPLGALITTLRTVRRGEREHHKRLFAAPRRDAEVLYGQDEDER